MGTPNDPPRGIWRQFSLRTLLAVVTVVALGLGVLSAWPRHIASFRVPRYEARPNLIDEVGTAFEVRFSRRWGRTYIDVVPRDGLGETKKAEFIWLEGGKLHRVAIGEEGRITADRIAVTTQWPLVFGVIQHHPRIVNLHGQWVSNDGLRGPTCEKGIDPTHPDLIDGTEAAAQRFLEDIQR